jgi:TetR/AcrR family fatty acid metabolism transcriptional regulator
VRKKTSEQEDKMLDAAARLFGSQRFHEVRMEDIAAEAGVGKGTLYRYFSDKEELYLDLLKRSSKQFLDRLQDEMERAPRPREQLEACVAAIICFFDEQPQLFDLIQRAEVLRDANHAFPWQHTREEVLKRILELFERGKEQGEFTIRDAEIAALMLLGGLRGVIRFGSRPRPRDLARRITDRFLLGADVSNQNSASSFRRPSLIREPSQS